MNKLNIRKNSVLLLITTLIVSIIAFAMFFGTGTLSTVSGTSGDRLDSSATPNTTIKMDLNGLENGRNLNHLSLIECEGETGYRQVHFTSTHIMYALYQNAGIEASGITFTIPEGSIYCSDTSFIKVARDSTESVIVTALKMTSDARFSIDALGSDNEIYTVIVKVEVDSTVASISGNSTLYVKDDASMAPSVISLDNATYIPQLIDLGTTLKGKKLLTLTDTTYSIAQGRPETGSAQDLVLYSLQNLTLNVTTNAVTGATINFSYDKSSGVDPLVTVDANITSVAVADGLKPFDTTYELRIDFTYSASTIRVIQHIRFNESAKPTLRSAFKMPTILNSANPSTAYYNNEELDIDGNFNTVKVTPDYLLDYAVNLPTVAQLEDGYGYKTQFFTGSTSYQLIETTSGVDYVKVTQSRDEEGNIFFNVSGSKDGEQTIKFIVNYGTITKQGDDIVNPSDYVEVHVTFSVYGSYALTDSIKISGKSAYTISVSTDARFASLRDDGFTFISADIFKGNASSSVSSIALDQVVEDGDGDVDGDADGSADPDAGEEAEPDSDLNSGSSTVVENVLVTIAGTNITLTPLTTGNNTILFTFTSGEGTSARTAVMTGSIVVDIAAGNFMSTWELWQIILFWVLIALAILIILLLIIWLFIRAVLANKREAQETQAPTSAYIIKLNSTIAAAQTQQRMGVGYYNNTNQPLQLGAGPSFGTAPGQVPPALQLAAGPAPVGQTMYADPVMSTPVSYGQTVGDPVMTAKTTTFDTPNQEIYIPISDEELLERIFVVKYEPRGMARRSFFKSKDLQKRELEKEKARIMELIKAGTPVEEACGLMTKTVDKNDIPEQEVEKAKVNDILGFDPNEAIVVVIEPEAKEDTKKIVIDEITGEETLVYDETTEEDVALEEALIEAERLRRELEIVKERLAAIEKALLASDNQLLSVEEKIAIQEKIISDNKEKITDNEIKLAKAKGKEKERLSKEMVTLEDGIKAAEARIIVLLKEKDAEKEVNDELNGHKDKFESKSKTIDDSIVEANKKVKDCEALVVAAQRIAEQNRRREAQNRQELYLTPLCGDLYVADRNVSILTTEIEADTQEKSALKGDTSAIQTQLLTTTDASIVARLSDALKEKNAEISVLDTRIKENTKNKTDSAIVVATNRKRGADFIANEDMELKEVIDIEDRAILDVLCAERIERANADKELLEQEVDALQEAYNELADTLDAKIAQAAIDFSDEVKFAESAVQEAEAELNGINEKLAIADEDEKLLLTIEQDEMQERLEELRRILDETKANGIKSNLEYKLHVEEEVNTASNKLEKAQNEYAEVLKILEQIANGNKYDGLLYNSGTGLVSKDYKESESLNYKKQLEKERLATEKAEMAARMAREDAEFAKQDATSRALLEAEEVRRQAEIDAENAKEKAKEEAEMIKKEAILEADAEKSKREAEEAIEEAEKAKREAESDAEKAKREAEEATDKAKSDAEDEIVKAKREAEEEIEKAKRDAEEEIEKAKREAEEAKRKAEEEIEATKKSVSADSDEIEKAKREAEADAEKAKRDAEEEIERMKREQEAEAKKAEEEAKKLEEAAAADKARIDEKIQKRKDQIAEMRKGLTDLKTEKEATDLKEKFYEISVKLDDEEKASTELKDLLDRCMNDAAHEAELIRYKELANQKPKRIVKKVTERVNKIQKPKSGARPRPDGSRPRPAGARPRPDGSRPRPAGARPRPDGSRPAGARPRPAGTRPASARPASARPASARPRPAGARPASSRTSSRTSTVRRSSSSTKRD